MEFTSCQRRAIRCFRQGNNMLLTGPAGTGKSTLIREFKRLKPNIYITATTGTAAFSIGGQTLHSWSGIGIRVRPISKILSSIKRNQKLNKEIFKLPQQN